MKNKICKNCRWWDKGFDHWEGNENNIIYHSGFCQNAKLMQESENVTIRLPERDGMTMNTIAVTGEEFGCVHHEK